MDHSKFVEAEKLLLEGAKEKDIVYGGLEEVMSTATNEVLEVAAAKNLDLRTAAYVLAINKLNDYYLTRGIDI
jgi:glutamate dehydrogenase (NAD(P)+)